jgi:hypothetical protein
MPTIEQIVANLPNGFHDARLLRLAIDYVTGQVVMGLDVVVNDERKPEYREGTLRVTGVRCLVVDPPGANASSSSSQPSRIDTGSGQPTTSVIDLPSVPPGYFLQWFFVNDWNAFIRVVAKDADFRWADINPPGP